MSDALELFEFVTNKFARNHDAGWNLSEDKKDLKYIRYESDTRGYNALPKRVWRAIKFYFRSSSTFTEHKYTWYRHPINKAIVAYDVFVAPEIHFPDVVLNDGSIIAFWAEDGEYIALTSPTVGRILLEMLKERPDDEYSVRILEEMERIHKERMYKE